MKNEDSVTLISTPTLSRRNIIKGTAAVVAGTAATAAATPFTALVSSGAAHKPDTYPSEVRVEASFKKNIVETDSGKVSGYVRNGILTFKGIPYGDSTAGKNRFMAPSKPTPWIGVRSALYWGPISPQASASTWVGRRGRNQFEDGFPSEDCLRLNVWTQGTTGKKRPVMVWIHGGGFSSGSDIELPAYDGESLARRGDIVLVSLNHRLNALGYANLAAYGSRWADASNAGMLDIVAALGWIKTNIANFGGDPGNVMIFGQSGGGGKVTTLMGMPAAQGLYHRASVQSGSNVTQLSKDRSPELVAALLEELGLTASTIDKIQDIPVDTIEEAAVRAVRKLHSDGPPSIRGNGSGPNWEPVVDGKNLPVSPWDPGAPTMSAKVPLIVGTVLNEFATSQMMHDPSLDDITMEQATKRIRSELRDKTDRVVAIYRRKYPQATPFEIMSRISATTSMRRNAVAVAERKAALNAAPAYLYLFEWQSPVLDGSLRAFHTSELAFCFHNTDRCAHQTGGGLEPRRLADKVSDAWIAFARSGNPNHPGLPAWPKFNQADCPTMIFDTECVVRKNPDTEERKAIFG